MKMKVRLEHVTHRGTRMNGEGKKMMINKEGREMYVNEEVVVRVMETWKRLDSMTLGCGVWW